MRSCPLGGAWHSAPRLRSANWLWKLRVPIGRVSYARLVICSFQRFLGHPPPSGLALPTPQVSPPPPLYSVFSHSRGHTFTAKLPAVGYARVHICPPSAMSSRTAPPQGPFVLSIRCLLTMPSYGCIYCHALEQSCLR